MRAGTPVTTTTTTIARRDARRERETKARKVMNREVMNRVGGRVEVEESARRRPTASLAFSGTRTHALLSPTLL
jgi:hypothetical protein